MEQLSKESTATTEQTTFDLIKGTFTAEEAKEILMHMLQKKIAFHELKIFSDEIRFSKTDEASLKRIEELRLSKNKTKAFLEQADKEGKRLKIQTYTLIETV